LPPGSASYVARAADGEIEHALARGEFVFVLDCRQKGKSSLMVRALERLHDQGIVTLRLDLQRFGTNLQPDQWYAGLLHSIGQELGLTPTLFEYWKTHLEIGPMTRWFSALEDVVLASVASPIVIFIDEVDFVQALPFSSDEFFAGIRECHNRRAESQAFRRLTFCLVGVATPSQLINNQDVTPFNIGRRVELTDFTREETRGYAAELALTGRKGNILLDRIHHWVAGHPYLTQILAAKIADDARVRTARDVDALVHRSLLSPEGRQREPNIADVERRLLESNLPGMSREESRSQILEVYGLLLRGHLVCGNHDAQLVAAILLSGVAVEEDGRLRPRNRLYRTLFDEAWRRESLPGAEARRQMAASKRAGWRVAWVSLGVFSVISTIVVWLLVLTQQRDVALASTSKANAESGHIAYQSSMALASERMEDGNYLQAYGLLERQRRSPERGWEWTFMSGLYREAQQLQSPSKVAEYSRTASYAWREGNSLIEARGGEIVRDNTRVYNFTGGFFAIGQWLYQTRGTAPFESRLTSARGIERKVAQMTSRTPGLVLQSLNNNGTLGSLRDPSEGGVYYFDLITNRLRHERLAGETLGLIVMPSGRRCLITSRLNSAIYDLGPPLVRRAILPLSDKLGGMAFNARSTLMVCAMKDPEVRIIRTSDGRIVQRLFLHSAVLGAELFANDKKLITLAMDGTVEIWNLVTGRPIRRLVTPLLSPSRASVSADEKSVLISTVYGAIHQWDLTAPPPVLRITAGSQDVTLARLSPDGNRCATSSLDGSCVLLDVPSGRRIAAFDLGRTFEAHSVAFSGDGRFLGLIDTSGALTAVDPITGKVLRRILFHGSRALRVAISSRGVFAVTLSDGRVAILDNWRTAPKFSDPGVWSYRLSFSPDGALLAVTGKRGGIVLLDAATLQTRRTMATAAISLRSVEFSPNGKWLSAASDGGQAYLFELDGAKTEHILATHAARVWSARFSPDSEKVMTNAFDGTVRIWSVKTGKELMVLFHSTWASEVAWSPDGRRIVTGASDRRIRIFDSQDGFELARFSEAKGTILDVSFTPDGKTLVSSSGDGTVTFRTAR
jgi:WD40 repeat protein